MWAALDEIRAQQRDLAQHHFHLDAQRGDAAFAVGSEEETALVDMLRKRADELKQLDVAMAALQDKMRTLHSTVPVDTQDVAAASSVSSV